jgi:predicted PurR-regulated permease PerM
VLLAATLVGGYLLFSQLATLLVLIIIAIVLSLPLEVAATQVSRLGVPRWIGALLALLAMLAVIVGVLVVAIPPFASELQRLADQLPQIVDQLRAKLGSHSQASTGDSVQRSLQRVIDQPQHLLGPVATIGLSVAGGIAATLVVIVGALYMAVDPKPLVNGVVRLFPPERREWVAEAMGEIRSTWIGWQFGVLVDMLVTGVLLYIGLTLIGLDYAAVFAALSGLCVVVPYFGSVVGGIPPVLFALAEHGLSTALVALGIYLLVQQIEGHIVIPMVMSRAVKLHPAVVLIGVVLVGEVFGFVGLIVAVPIITATVVIVRELWVRRLEGEAPTAPARPPAEG